jgi:hypothetical protein
MLRSKEDNLLVMIDSALEAIRARIIEIGPDSSSCSYEARQLQEALYYLTLLLDNASGGGKFILC